jgi:hypothetical protein
MILIPLYKGSGFIGSGLRVLPLRLLTLNPEP